MGRGASAEDNEAKGVHRSARDEDILISGRFNGGVDVGGSWMGSMSEGEYLEYQERAREQLIKASNYKRTMTIATNRQQEAILFAWQHGLGEDELVELSKLGLDEVRASIYAGINREVRIEMAEAEWE